MYRDRLERLVEYLPTDAIKNNYKQAILQAEEHLKKQVQMMEKELEEEFSRLPQTSERLSFESIRVTFNKAITSKSAKARNDFDIWLINNCKKRR